ncbi:proprotein convertase subtilisin/kexin type 5 isoform X1 [Hyla sarda]|uniref:proprotein convertase subtilisin/kexin type 5 isoform X1 n=1 Tax=Hyla sarda TaxID=327740 RepID=UPI0024C390C4|nr:proprotein convertase subtilisin/kexin type 5 isoform X1 [Hyla sarda]
MAWKPLLVLTVLLGILVPTCRAHIYTNHWAVRIKGGAQEADRIASKYGYLNMGKIGSLQDYYHFYHSKTIKRSVLSSQGTHNFISMEPKVEWIEQQVVKRRTKRDYKVSNIPSAYFNDPKWPSMWYIHCSENAHHCQSDMNIVGAWKRGYTGKNVVVTILDDGIERNHPDLMQNYDPLASTDINGNDYDPMPRYDASNENKHGTRCAGEVAATANNSHCTVGIAFNARIGGVRMLDGDVTDMVEAKSLSLNPQHVHIYSASWGPDDDGKTVDGPASLARDAFENGIRTGRRGYGSIFVWASGNGGRSRDHCSCDGYTNSIYTISISSTTESGKKPWYLEECASTLATTYSSGESYDRKVITTDLRQRCTDSHTGTSASAPMAAGIIALALEANPTLTWRDVQHIIVKTSRQRHLNAPDWKTNAAGHKVSHLYGFGLMDAEAMVIEADKWNTVPAQHICVENTDRQIKTIRPDNVVRSVYKATGCADNANHHVIYLEHVVVRITITHPRRGDLAIYLTSPSGTRSQLLANRLFDHSMEGFKNWEFMTTHCWGEKASGDWILEIYDTPSQLRNFKTPGKLKEWSLVLYGTSIQPYSHRSDGHKVGRSSPIDEPSEEYNIDDYTGPCDAECSDVRCDGPGPHHCNDCLHYYYKAKNNTRICVSECPSGHYFAEKKRCKKCFPNCETCVGSRSDQCTSCKPGYYLNEETNSCTTNCPDGFYLNENKKLCRKCHENCKTCTSADNCTECRHGLSLQGSRCLISCEDGKYYSMVKKECEPCHRSCATCSGAGIDNCINCAKEMFFEDGRCVTLCGSQYYIAPPKANGFKTCKRCDGSCLSCSGPGDRNCTTCPDGYLLQGNTCSVGTVCKDGQYNENIIHCMPCDASCYKCTGPGRQKCIGCSITRFLDDGQCVLTCPVGKYELNRLCHLCHHTCLTCNDSQPDACTSCGIDKFGRTRYLYEGECREGCPETYYIEDNRCVPCPENCQSCKSSKQCDKCLKGFSSVNGVCQKLNCPEGEVEDPDSEECVSCAMGCKQCSADDPDLCSSCFANYYMFENSCHAVCPDNTYSRDAIMICLPCEPTCLSCVEDECIVCKKGFYLKDGVCVTDCGLGFYADDVDRECDSCFRTCDVCTGPAYDECTTCKPNFQFQNGKCVSSSGHYIRGPPGSYWNEYEKAYQPCDDTCLTCNTSSITCTSCRSGKYLHEEDCISSCPKGTFNNIKDRRCEKCTEDCEMCTENNECLKCTHDYLHDGRCYKKCPEGFFGQGQGCTECDEDCRSCDRSADYCLSCHAPKILQQATCISTCPVKFIEMNGICKHCPPDCLSCVNEEICAACMPDYFLHKDKCLSLCPDGFYGEDGNCVYCDPVCAKCSGPDHDDCEKCASPKFFLYNGECLGRCPQGTFSVTAEKHCHDCDPSCETCHTWDICDECKEGFSKNRQGDCVPYKVCTTHEYPDEYGECVQCHRKCSRCMGATEHHCLSCKENSFLLNTTCVDTCPDGYYADDDERRCVTCHRSCKTCTGKRSINCLTCKEGLYVQGHSCVQQCTTGYFADNSTTSCQKCHMTCNECQGPDSSDCLSCHNIFFLMRAKKQCHSSCPEFYYEDHAQKACERCHPTCRTCSGSGALSCTSCVSSYQLSGNICNSECFAGEFKLTQDPDAVCEKCHESCIECKGPGPNNCTVCPASFSVYVDEGRCVHCCGAKPEHTGECCDCSETLEECILITGLLEKKSDHKKAALSVAISILLVLTILAVLFIWRRARAKSLSINKGGYEKLPDQTKSFQSFKSTRESTSSFQQDHVIEYKDRDEEEDDDDDEDIVYMGQDGTVYRKFKYGLLEDDDDEDLEYDDESYSFR